MPKYIVTCNDPTCLFNNYCSNCYAGDFDDTQPFEGDCQSPPAATLRAGGESAAKLSLPPAGIDPNTEKSSERKFRELRALIHPDVMRRARTAASFDDVSLPVWVGRALLSHLQNYPF